MNKYKGLRHSTMRDYMILAGTLIVSVLLIVYFLPRESTYHYDFDLNKPWKYGQVIAKFDFPIYKSDQVLRVEKDSVLRLFQPYFSKDKEIEKQQIKNLRNDFYSGRIKQVPVGYMPHLVQMLHKVYETGVVKSEMLSTLADSSIATIRSVSGTEAVSISIKELFSTRTAYEYIMQADTLHFPRELLRRCNLNNYIEANLIYDEDKSRAMKEDLLSTVSYASGMVQSGQKIIDRGEIVDAKTYGILESLEKEAIKRNDTDRQANTIIIGQIMFASVLMILFSLYLGLFRKDYFDTPNYLLLLFSLMVIYPIITSLMVSRNLFSVYLIPFAIVPIFVRVFMDTRTAFMTHIVTILLCSMSLHNPYEFLLIQFVAGLAAIYSLKELTLRSQLLRAAVIVTMASLVFGFAYDLMQGIDIHSIDTRFYTYLVVNGILLLFAYPLMFLVEKAFGFTSSVTLIELSNINNELMKRMSKVAQGTFNHSMQVANLATEVANKIGAKVQLVRTGAMYHDIGKMENPAFFTENQTGVNPHDSIAEEQSAQIIINHVTDGVKLADKYHLPKVIRDFITTHHGKSKAKYFYISYVNKHPDEQVNERAFTYPGPNPSTREQAILMMADSVEAASRSLDEFTESSISELVNRIIDSQMKEGYFENCPITFKDIMTAKLVFIENLKMIYHTRISYPELKKQEDSLSEGERPKVGLFTGGLHRNRQ